MYLAYNFTTVTEILVDHLKRIVNTKNRKILFDRNRDFYIQEKTH